MCVEEGRAEGARVSKRAFARVGLMGNPSDGFNGKTISLSIRNFWAKVRWKCIFFLLFYGNLIALYPLRRPLSVVSNYD